MAVYAVSFDDATSRLKKAAVGLPDFRSGRVTIGSGASTISVTFSTALPNTNYAVQCTWHNTTDSNPQFQPVIVTSFSTTGFTAKWNAPTDTANYSLNWQALAFA